MKTLGLLISLFAVLAGTNAYLRTVCEHRTMNINCGSSRTVYILTALYGRTNRKTCSSSSIRTTNCRASNSVTKVRQACHGKHSCSIRASNSVFGDPCRYTFKYLQVLYLCKATSVPSVTICEHRKRTISCPSGKALDIISAVYGRSDRTTCPSSSIRTTSCAASNSANVVKSSCNGRNSCSLYASNSVFGDPCIGTFKYLQVKYRCVVTRSESTVICEHKRGRIACPVPTRIRIIDADYGRTNKNTCHSSANNNINCGRDVTAKVKALCEGGPECYVTASNSLYGDPCRGTYKYLHIKYICAI